MGFDAVTAQTPAINYQESLMQASRAFLILALSGVSVASMAAENQMEKMDKMSAPAPTEFVMMAAQGGMTEVTLSKLAKDKSSNEQVQKFAERMIADHGKANAELASIAKAKGIEVPMELDAMHESVVTEMQGKEGAEFDSAYAQHMDMDHKKTIALFEGEAKGTDKELAGFARKTLPTLMEHKKMISRLPGNKMGN